MAVDMANVHNALIRGLNAIYLQCTHISSPTDIADFALYIKAWADTMHHHHQTEEAAIFPGFDRIAKRAGATESVMDASVNQHHLFEPGLVKLIEYAKDVQGGKRAYVGEEMKRIIDGFAPVLTEHLFDEINTLLSLDKFDGGALKKVYDGAVSVGAKTADPVSNARSLVLPCFDG